MSSGSVCFGVLDLGLLHFICYVPYILGLGALLCWIGTSARLLVVLWRAKMRSEYAPLSTEAVRFIAILSPSFDVDFPGRLLLSHSLDLI